jgi:vancomycin resistance protein YoaR
MDNRSVSFNKSTNPDGSSRHMPANSAGTPRRRRTGPRLRILRLAFIVLAALFVTFGILTVTVKPGDKEISAYIDNGTFFEGISVNGTDISGMTYDEARNALIPVVNEDVSSVNISVVYGSTRWTFTASDLGISTSLNEALKEAMSSGRSGTLLENTNMQKQIKENGLDIKVRLEPDDAKIEQLLSAISLEINQEPVEPCAVPDTSGTEPAFSFVEGSDGHVLNKEAVSEEIRQSIENGDYGRTIQPALELVSPTRTMDWVKENTKQIAVFSTSFEGRTLGKEDRVRNIEKASDILNGMKLEPGQEISFNEYVGPRTEKGGWALAPGIVNGNTYVLQAGGGICQVSTTIYNTLLRCGPGIEITDRKKHSWPSSYVPEGLDATVSTDGPDLAFKNNTEAPIFIFTYPIDHKMTVYVYGAPLPDGVTYEVRSEILERTEPPEPQIIEEPLWPAGYSEDVRKSHKGCVAVAYRDKLVNGQVVETVELYTDTYRAVQGQKKVGTGPETLPKPSSNG